MRLNKLAGLALAAALGFGTSAAYAQDAMTDDDLQDPAIVDNASPAPADPDADLLDGSSTRIIERGRSGPAVYGWQSCGTYFYWDGETCVDARLPRSER